MTDVQKNFTLGRYRKKRERGREGEILKIKINA
jgi:hypothetical protein